VEIDFLKVFKLAKYLIIPILFFLYISYADVILASGPSVFGAEQGAGGGAGGIQVIGLGLATSVSVSRLYFGMFRLPVYAADLGDISGIHDTFFTILGIITVIFVAWDLRFLLKGLKGKTSYTYGSKYQWRR
jgi:hypothetical protein